MGLCLNRLSRTLQASLLRKENRLFGLLGKVTPQGLVSFQAEDICRAWVLTAEFGCLRLEQLSGEEELTANDLFLPAPSGYEYGVTGGDDALEITRTVFGLLPAELDRLLSTL